MAGFQLNTPTSKYCLKFYEGLDLKNEVLVKLRTKLVPILDNKHVNKEVISQLNSTLLFTIKAIKPLLTGEYKTEDERMHELFDLIQGCENDGILVCLEKLCDLNDLPQVSKRIREKITAEFPDSVQLR